ncbi:GD10623 [Drosophila simulans]|uniref:GD10623 n=1 Tax=Drosophila simulans TaxID=7240 RepID=B4QGQ8_DROSI|nr:GD10623 [Drosophila simulans]
MDSQQEQEQELELHVGSGECWTAQHKCKTAATIRRLTCCTAASAAAAPEPTIGPWSIFGCSSIGIDIGICICMCICIT